MNRWKNYFYQLLNVHSVSVARQVEIHAAETLVPKPNLFEVEIAIANLERDTSSGTEKILAELIQAVSETLHSEVHKPLILFRIRKNCLRCSKSLWEPPTVKQTTPTA
jgi:hypothetical protein